MGFSAGAGLTMHAALQSDTMDLAFIAPIYGGKADLIPSWYEAGKPVEFHPYQNGGHGFGLGNPDRTSNRWFDAFQHGLEVNGFTG